MGAPISNLDFLYNNGEGCPMCGAALVDTDKTSTINPGNGSIYVAHECHECEAKWDNCYTLDRALIAKPGNEHPDYKSAYLPGYCEECDKPEKKYTIRFWRTELTDVEMKMKIRAEDVEKIKAMDRHEFEDWLYDRIDEPEGPDGLYELVAGNESMIRVDDRMVQANLLTWVDDTCETEETLYDGGAA